MSDDARRVHAQLMERMATGLIDMQRRVARLETQEGLRGAGSWWARSGDDIYYDDGAVQVVNLTAAPTNSVSLPGEVDLVGRGWLTDVGSRVIAAQISADGAYVGARGAAYPDVVFSTRGSDEAAPIERMRIRGRDGNVGIATNAPGRIFEIAVGAGNARADGWDIHSLRAYKRDVRPMDRTTVLARLCAAPPQRWKADVKDAGKAVEVERCGLVADSEAVTANLPEVLSRDYETGEIGGIKLTDYIATLHAGIVELVAQNAELKARIEKLEG